MVLMTILCYITSLSGLRTIPPDWVAIVPSFLFIVVGLFSIFCQFQVCIVCAFFDVLFLFISYCVAVINTSIIWYCLFFPNQICVG